MCIILLLRKKLVESLVVLFSYRSRKASFYSKVMLAKEKKGGFARSRIAYTEIRKLLKPANFAGFLLFKKVFLLSSKKFSYIVGLSEMGYRASISDDCYFSCLNLPLCPIRVEF